MAKLDLKKSIRGRTFFTKLLPYFSGKQKAGDQSIFDRRGMITITDQEVRGRDGEIKKIRGIKDIGGNNSMVLSRPGAGTTVDFSKAMDAYHGWPYAAINPIADEIAGIEWKVYKSGPDKREVEHHALIDLLEAVNETQTGVEFKHTLATHLELTGNAFVYLEGVSDESSQPTAMYLLDPSRVKVILNKITFPFKLQCYKFTIEGKEFTFQPYQVLHIKYPNPTNQWMGKGPVEGAAEWIDNDNNSTEFLRQFFKNGAQIGVTFETEMVSEDQLQELRDSFNEQHAGTSNAYKAMFLPKGVKKPENDVKFDDIGMDEIGNSNRDRILAAFRVPKTIIGAAESDTNRATAETADYVFAKRTIKPKMILICSYLNEFLVPRFGSDIFLTFVDPVTEDAAAKSAQMKNEVGSAPVITVNEAREEYLGKDPIDGGDQLLSPNSLIPAIDAGKQPAPMTFSVPSPREDSPKGLKVREVTGKIAPKKEEKTLEPVAKSIRRERLGYIPARIERSKTQFARNVEIRKSMREALSSKITDIITTIKRKNVMEMTDKEYDDVITVEKISRESKYAKQIVAELIKLNEDQKKEVLKNLPDAVKSVKEIKSSSLFDLDKWINLTIDALTPIGLKLMQAESDQALDLIDEPGLDIANIPSAQKALDQAMSLMSRSYNEDTISILSAKLTEGLGEGFGVQKLGELVSDIYEFKNTVAAERVALTESNRITNTAAKIAWKESGVVKEVKWVTSRRDNVCPFCAEMEGTIISIDENFLDKHQELEGTDGTVMTADYSDIGGPPLHPNCHCAIRPVVFKKTQAILGGGKNEGHEEIGILLETTLDKAIEEIKHA